MTSIKSKTIPWTNTGSSNLVDGIFSYLKAQTSPSYPDEAGVVSLTTNYPSEHSVPKNLMDRTNTYWCSGLSLDAYLLIDFKKNKASISNYVISNYGHDYPREWKMLGSNDNKQWTLLSHEYTNYQSTESVYYNLLFTTKSLKIFRYIKIIQLQSRTYVNGAHLAFYELELYGTYYSNSDAKIIVNTCKNQNQGNIILFSMIVIVS